MIKSTILAFFLIASFPSFGQKNWTNLAEENQAQAALDQKKYPLAIELYRKALEIRKAKYPYGLDVCDLNAFKEIVKAMNNLATAHEKFEGYGAAIGQYVALSKWAEEGMQAFPKESNPYSEYGLAQIQIAKAFQSLGNYKRGEQVCQKLIRYFQKRNDNIAFNYVAPQVIAIAHGRIGEILRDEGETKNSATQHEKSVEKWQKLIGVISDKLAYKKIASQSEICVARFKVLKDTTNVIKYGELALTYYERSTKKDPKNEDFLRGIENISNILAFHLSAKGEYQQAIEYFKKSLAINDKKFRQNNKADYLIQLTAVNMKVSDCYASLGNISKSVEYLNTRIEQLKLLQKLLPKKDYAYSISRNQYNLAKKYEKLGKKKPALTVIDESIALSPIAIERDPKSTRKKEWQWIQEFYRYQLLRDMENYELAYSSLERLKSIFQGLEELAPDIQYSEFIKEVVISQNELAYPKVVKLNMEIDYLPDGTAKFTKLQELVKFLKKQKRKDISMRLSFLKHTSKLAWTGLMTGNYKPTKKALKKAMRLKPVDPYLITNYAPCLLFLGKYRKADKVYTKYYNQPFKPGQKIINGFLDDIKEFEEKGVIPVAHQVKMEQVKAKLNDRK